MEITVRDLSVQDEDLSCNSLEEVGGVKNSS